MVRGMLATGVWRETEGGCRVTTEQTPAAGHNTGGIAADRLRSIVDRIERLEEERKGLGSDIKDIYTEAKSAGFDVKVLRQLIALRRREPAEVEEMETLLDVYRRALGDFVSTPLGEAAVRGAGR